MPRSQQILAVELLRLTPKETAVVLTVALHGRVVQYELRGDARGANPQPFITKQPHGGHFGGDRPTHAAPITASAGLATSPAAESVPIGYPPPKEDPPPGVVALGTSLLSVTFDLGEQAIPESRTS